MPYPTDSARREWPTGVGPAQTVQIHDEKREKIESAKVSQGRESQLKSQDHQEQPVCIRPCKQAPSQEKKQSPVNQCQKNDRSSQKVFDQSAIGKHDPALICDTDWR